MATNRQAEPDDGETALDSVSRLFESLEHWITIGIGAVLVLATVLLLTGSLAEVWRSIRQWPEANDVFLIVDQLLFVLMLVEILHTVRASIASHRLAVEPFLIVGLIATVRRMLIVTVESSDMTPAGHPKPPFEHAMIELGVLGGLTIVLIVSIFIARLSRRYLPPDVAADLAGATTNALPRPGQQ